MARPSKLTEELINEMYENLLVGLPIISCCDLLCITQPCHQNWMTIGEEDFKNEVESLHAKYFMTIKKGRADFEKKALKDIQTGRPGWQGMAWVLERTNQKYMPKQEVVAEEGKVNVIIGGKVKEVKRNDN